LGSTSNAAFLAATYAAYEMPSNAGLASRYTCWARSQLRYMLGDSDQSYVVVGPTERTLFHQADYSPWRPFCLSQKLSAVEV